MLYPTLESLVNIVGNRYLLVNITAKRAREIAEEAIESGHKLEDKSVKLAVQQIYEEGVRGKEYKAAPACKAECGTDHGADGEGE